MTKIKNQFSSIEEAVEDIRLGKMVIVVDDPSRENEGDLIMAAEKATPQAVNFMAKHGRGLICVPMLPERLKTLSIHPMVETPQSDVPGKDTAFTISVDAKRSTTTGISAHDRSATIRTLIHPQSGPEDFIRPGHVFPLKAKEGGVLVRAGHTEAALDLVRLARLYPAGVICEILNPDGTMARTSQLLKFAKKHKLKIVTITDLIKYRRQNEKLVRCHARANLPTRYGEFTLHLYEDLMTGKQHLAMVMGEVRRQKGVLVRVHSSCITGDTLGSLKCDCGTQLDKALRMISSAGRGVLIYLNQEGRGIGLLNKIKSYALQDQGLDTVQANEALGFKADLREYGIGAQILADLGLSSIKILTNNPRKIVGIEGYGLKVTERVPMQVPPNRHNIHYIKVKKEKLGHMLEVAALQDPETAKLN